MKDENLFYNQLGLAKEFLFDNCEFKIKEFLREYESQEYEACRFKLNNLNVIFRASKITPTKVGQFVTIWKRNEQKITEPFDQNDDFDFVIICSQDTTKFGLFVFSKNVLVEKGIVTGNGKVGKRGIRVYPIWNTVTNKQAHKTQLWQTKHFIQINDKSPTDFIFAKGLFEHF